MTDAVASPAAGLEAYERFPLLHGPSPVHRLARLTEHLRGPEIWAKREDVNTGVGMGGNKLRKLEYLVADALAQGCDTLVSIGATVSSRTLGAPLGSPRTPGSPGHNPLARSDRGGGVGQAMSPMATPTPTKGRRTKRPAAPATAA
jgi:hypothetical protein